jgi:hypothetical protein
VSFFLLFLGLFFIPMWLLLATPLERSHHKKPSSLPSFPPSSAYNTDALFAPLIHNIFSISFNSRSASLLTVTPRLPSEWVPARLATSNFFFSAAHLIYDAAFLFQTMLVLRKRRNCKKQALRKTKKGKYRESIRSGKQFEVTASAPMY